jgi:hypothetical protein
MPGGVCQQMPERHRGRAGRNFDTYPFQVVVHRLVEREESFVTQLHDSDRGQGLRD